MCFTIILFSGVFCSLCSSVHDDDYDEEFPLTLEEREEIGRYMIDLWDQWAYKGEVNRCTCSDVPGRDGSYRINHQCELHGFNGYHR